MALENVKVSNILNILSVLGLAGVISLMEVLKESMIDGIILLSMSVNKRL